MKFLEQQRGRLRLAQKKVEICKKVCAKCGIFFIIRKFPFPDVAAAAVSQWRHID